MLRRSDARVKITGGETGDSSSRTEHHRTDQTKELGEARNGDGRVA